MARTAFGIVYIGILRFMFMKINIRYLFLILVYLLCVDAHSQSFSLADARDLLEKTRYNKKRGNLEGAIGYGLLGLDQAEGLDDQGLIIDFRRELGDIYLDKKDHKKSVTNYLAILRLGKAMNDDNLSAEGYLLLGNAYHAMEAYQRADNNYSKAVAQYAKLTDNNGTARALAASGINFSKSNQVSKAIYSFERLMKLAVAEKQYSYISVAEEYLFKEYYKQGKTSEALKYGLSYYDRIQSKAPATEVAMAANQLAELYLNSKQYKEALKYATIAITKDRTTIEYNETLGQALAATGSYAKGVDAFNKAIDLYERKRKTTEVARVYNKLASAAYQKGDEKTALTHLSSAEMIASKRNAKVILLDTYQLLSTILSEQGDQPESERYQKLYDGVKIQIGQGEELLPNISQVNESLAENYEQQAIATLSSIENKKLAEERENLRQQQKLKDLELAAQESKLKDIELEQEALEKKRIAQELLIARQNNEALARQKELEDLQKEAEVISLKEAQRRRQLELLEKEKEFLQQQKEFEEKETEQAKLMQYIIIGGSILILAILGLAFFKTIKTNRTISEQNQNLAEQQKTILNRNIQLKKSSEAMLAMNNKLKKAHVNLKVLLKKEQETKEELEKANQEIKNTQVHLVQAEKMSSLGLLTAGIAHEINNPINFVSSGVQSLLQNFEELNVYIENYQKVLGLNDLAEIKKYASILKEDEEALNDLRASSEELLEDVNYGVSRITEIVNGLRSFSRHDEAEVKDADINESFNSALLILKNKYKNKAEIVLQYDENLPQIQCFPGQINQVFVNLINNALDAMDDFGKIIITTKDLNDDYIEMTIEDTGSGMPDEIKDKIFDPFFTTKDIGKGTGLGLSISHGIIEKHNGEIRVESKMGVGTTFIIKLPKKLEVDGKILEDQLL